MEETKQLELSNRLYLAIAVLIGAIIIFCLTAAVFKFQSIPGNEPRYITVSGQGKVYVVPDIAVVSFGITKEGIDVSSLSSKTNEQMNKIIADIKDLGVDEKDIQTTQYSLTPRYNYVRESGERILVGYEMTQSISVKIRDFAKIGSIFSVATSSEANIVNSLYFTVDDPEKSKQEAREKAVEQAKEKAVNIAKATGLSLGKLTDVSEGYSTYDSTYNKSVGMGGAADAMIAPDIQPGQQEVNMTMTLTYRIR